MQTPTTTEIIALTTPNYKCGNKRKQQQQKTIKREKKEQVLILITMKPCY